jgi:hypothetical protein
MPSSQPSQRGHLARLTAQLYRDTAEQSNPREQTRQRRVHMFSGVASATMVGDADRVVMKIVCDRSCAHCVADVWERGSSQG